MNKTAKYLSLTACALAASLFLSGCGGAEGADAVAPTVAITSAASGSTITFTFTFSEALGTGTGDPLTKEEITVVGGTAGTFTVVDTTHATLTVTATAATVSVSVAASKFADVSHNFNTVAASGTYSRTLITFEETVAPTLTDFGGNASSIVVDPAGGSGHVAKVIKSATAATWAGTTVSTGTNQSLTTVPLATGSMTMSLRVWAPAVGMPIRLKLEDASNNTHTLETETTTTVANGWQTLTFNFANQATGTAAFNSAFTYNKASVFFNFGTDGATAGEKTFYFDDLIFGTN